MIAGTASVHTTCIWLIDLICSIYLNDMVAMEQFSFCLNINMGNSYEKQESKNCDSCIYVLAGHDLQK